MYTFNGKYSPAITAEPLLTNTLNGRHLLLSAQCQCTESAHWHCMLNSRCLLFRVSVNRGSTVIGKTLQCVGRCYRLQQPLSRDVGLVLIKPLYGM